MAVVAYCRVSTGEQSLDIQEEIVSKYGVDKVFAEKVSGTTQSRPKLKECLSYVREGDVLVVTKLDRLARSVSPTFTPSMMTLRDEVLGLWLSNRI